MYTEYLLSIYSTTIRLQFSAPSAHDTYNRYYIIFYRMQPEALYRVSLYNYINYYYILISYDSLLLDGLCVECARSTTRRRRDLRMKRA